MNSPYIRYIGQDHADLDLFESQYPLSQGMSYNSYLILDEKVAIMDTSDPRTMEPWKADLAKALDGRQPDYLVVHHLEPDHAGGVAQVMELYPGLTVVCTAKAAQMLPQYVSCPGLAERILPVKEGDTLDLGRHRLTFVTAPMVHWPEVMVSYEATERWLFSADAFGTFGVRAAETEDWATEARRYYYNICGKYGAPVTALLKKAAALDIRRILPLHGPELGGEAMARALALYTCWGSYGVESPGVLIAHASIHGNTRQAAELLARRLQELGCPQVSLADLCRQDHAWALAEAFRYGTVVLAASSYDAGVFTPMHAFLHRLQIKLWQKRRVALIENGSWAPSAGRVMKAALAEMKDISLMEPMITLRGCVKKEDVEALDRLAHALLG